MASNLVCLNLASENQYVFKRFGSLVEYTPCPYAGDARVYCAPEWEPLTPFIENVDRLVPSLDRFVDQIEALNLDIFVVEVRQADSIYELRSFAALLHGLLYALNHRDPNRIEPLEHNIMSMDWDFLYKEERFFVPTFAPFYPPNHPRNSRNHGSAFILFQSDHAFSRRGINSKSPDRPNVSLWVYGLFRQAGMDYSMRLVTQRPKAERYVKPFRVDDEPIRWWQEDFQHLLNYQGP